MEEENAPAYNKERFKVLGEVTPFSKYLALILFIALPFMGGWIGFEYGVASNKSAAIPLKNDDHTSKLIKEKIDTSALLTAILSLDPTKIWSIEYASNQSILGEQSYNADIASGVLLTASTDVEGGRADTLATPEGADYIRLVTSFLKEQGYEQVDFYEGLPGSFGSLFKLDDGLYLKLRGLTIGRDVRVEEQGDFFESVPRRFEYEIFITDINNLLPVDQNVVVGEFFTDTLVPDAEIFFSNRHGVGFTYVSIPCVDDLTSPWDGLNCVTYPDRVRVYETRNQIYVGSQSISVYDMESLGMLQNAITNRFLTQENTDECLFEPGNLSLPQQYEQIRLVPVDYEDNTCGVNPFGVFVMNREVPSKFIYVIVGQEPYLPSGSIANPSEIWQESIRIVH